MGKYDDPIPSNPDNGMVRGDSKAMPDRGTSSGMVGMGAPYGADVGINATNSMGSAYMACDSAFDNCPRGDVNRFTASSHGFEGRGTAMSGADSDPMMDDTPADQRA